LSGPGEIVTSISEIALSRHGGAPAKYRGVVRGRPNYLARRLGRRGRKLTPQSKRTMACRGERDRKLAAIDRVAIGGRVITRCGVARLGSRKLEAVYRSVTLDGKTDRTGTATKLIRNTIGTAPCGGIRIVIIAADRCSHEQDKRQTKECPFPAGYAKMLRSLRPTPQKLICRYKSSHPIECHGKCSPII
jgi:hypothetical protein